MPPEFRVAPEARIVRPDTKGTPMPHFTKDPSAVLDWDINWLDWLSEVEVISNYSVTATGVTVDSTSEAGGVITVWLSGGTAGETAKVVCEVSTTGGRTDQRTVSISISER